MVLCYSSSNKLILLSNNLQLASLVGVMLTWTSYLNSLSFYFLYYQDINTWFTYPTNLLWKPNIGNPNFVFIFWRVLGKINLWLTNTSKTPFLFSQDIQPKISPKPHALSNLYTHICTCTSTRMHIHMYVHTHTAWYPGTMAFSLSSSLASTILSPLSPFSTPSPPQTCHLQASCSSQPVTTPPGTQVV